MNDSDEPKTQKEAERRRDELLKRLLQTPPQPRPKRERKPKTKPASRKPRPKN